MAQADGEAPESEVRPFRSGTLREILDEEFVRNSRFEGLTHLFTDFKGFLKNFVERNDDEVEGLKMVERDGR